jgi:HupE / UreJ protein
VNSPFRAARGARAAQLLAAMVVAMVAATAHAHQASMKTMQVTVGGGAAARHLEIEVRAAVVDVAAVVGLDGTQATRAQVLATAGVAASVASWVAVRSGRDPEAPCLAAQARAAADRDPSFLAVTWALDCPSATTELTFDLQTFFALDASHTMVVRLDSPQGSFDTIVGVDDSPLHLHLGAPSGSFWRWLRLGISHILGGADHICFVITLLIAVVIYRRPEAQPESTPTVMREPPAAPAPSAGPPPAELARWQLRAPRQALRAMAVLVTAFSVSHSLTLIAASLGWIVLPSRFVETAIALSIFYAAVENLLRPDAPWRWALTFAFGLLHGLGFASALRELLPADHVIVPLLAFNLGVEFGQLLIVAAAMPLLLGLGRVLSVRRYKTWFLPTVSVALAMLALAWGIQRAFALTL